MRSRNRQHFEKFGDTFFVTFSIIEHIRIFDDVECCKIVADNIKFYQDREDFILLAYVIMPNHVHLVPHMNENQSISKCIGSIKRITSRQISAYLRDKKKHSMLAKLRSAACKKTITGCRVWNPRFDCFVIQNTETLRQKIEYIHNNPVKAGLIQESVDWPFSSAGTYAGKPGMNIKVDTEWICLGYA